MTAKTNSAPPLARTWQATWREKRATAPDGTKIAYEVLGQGEETLLLANGLGGRLYSWEPLIEAFWRRYRMITWDYRGLFNSDAPVRARRLAVVHHAEDALAILDAENVKRAAFVGWSMGVQVSLDLAAAHPERCAGLVLMNGTHGHTMSTGLQPLFSVPFLPKRLHAIVEWLIEHPDVATTIARISRITEYPTALLLTAMSGADSRRMQPLIRRYFDDVLGPSFPNYLRLFQELDAHSVYHLLPSIDVPALVVSGLLDALTPAYQSREIARRLPDAEHLAVKRGSHFVLLERPEIVVPRVASFFERRARFA